MSSGWPLRPTGTRLAKAATPSGPNRCVAARRGHVHCLEEGRRLQCDLQALAHRRRGLRRLREAGSGHDDAKAPLGVGRKDKPAIIAGAVLRDRGTGRLEAHVSVRYWRARWIEDRAGDWCSRLHGAESQEDEEKRRHRALL